MYKYLFSFFLLFSTLFLQGEDMTTTPQKKRFFLSACALFKNEAKYLKEWLEYHLLIGVDHFYLYNLDSSDQFMKALAPYIERDIVTLVYWHDYIGELPSEETFKWALGMQIPAYENALHLRAKKETEWLVFLDVDEFLVSTAPRSIIETLKKYADFPGVTLACEYFDVSAKKNTIPKRKLLIETVELTKPPEENLQKQICKTIFKPEHARGFLWPPYKCLFKDEQFPIAVAKRELRINHYLHRKEGYFYAKAKPKLHIDNRMLSDEQMKELLSLDYEIEDQDRAIYRHVPELLIRMGYDPTWGW